jgi:tyrosyl-tRNA synthetase
MGANVLVGPDWAGPPVRSIDPGATVPGSAILDDLLQRGLVHDSTDLDELRHRLDQGPITLYAGFDPTAESLHVGNLVPLLLLRRFQLHGHRPLALAGGATGMIGDPGGRSEERNLLDGPTLDRNLAAIKVQLRQLLDFDSPENPARLVDNRTWTEPVGVLEFLRDVGKHVTVNQMLAKESIRARVASDAGISFTEFSYMLLQANDFWWLNHHDGCELQVGGSDQWGNITAGIDLIRRRAERTVFGLTVPLLTRADGQKFGKSVAGAVWLDPERTSPYAFYQHFVNVDDRDVERFLLQLTFMDVGEVAAVVEAHRARPEERAGQRRLAHELTALVHGAAAAVEAEQASRGFTRPARELSTEELATLADEIPTAPLHIDQLGQPLAFVLVEAGMEKSRSSARKMIEGGGIYVNDEPAPPERVLEKADLLVERYVMLRRGKKQRLLLVLSDAGPT